MKIKTTAMTAALAVALGTTLPVPTVRAQIPVTDVASIVQRAIEAAMKLAKMVAQLEQLKAQLNQAKDTYESMTGQRGMRWLMMGQDYSRLPTDWSETVNMLDPQGGGYGSYRIKYLAGQILENMNEIDPSVFEDVDSVYSKLALEDARQAATAKALQATQYDDVSARFRELKDLIREISSAEDQKAILDLQARITAQQAMLRNEALKMRALAQLRKTQNSLQKAKRQQAWLEDAHADPAPLTPVRFGGW